VGQQQADRPHEPDGGHGLIGVGQQSSRAEQADDAADCQRRPPLPSRRRLLDHSTVTSCSHLVCMTPGLVGSQMDRTAVSGTQRATQGHDRRPLARMGTPPAGGQRHGMGLTEQSLAPQQQDRRQPGKARPAWLQRSGLAAEWSTASRAAAIGMARVIMTLLAPRRRDLRP
jgi:hypothetical protein